MKIKILSYNIHKGFDWKNHRYQLDAIKKLIIHSGAEIVFLQEVVGKNERLKKRGLIDSQFEYLADEIWSHHSYAQNAIYDSGHHGNLILSKYPIVQFENINISTNSLEQRGMLVTKIDIPLGKTNKSHSIYCVCVHLNLLHSGRKLQYEKIKEELSSRLNVKKESIIIAGDFNDWNQKSFEIFENTLRMQETHKFLHHYYAKTFPARFPFLSLDRIYTKNFKIISSSVLALNPKLSDHLPLFCELQMTEG